jgi:arylsulfatase A-like enzyme
MIKITTMRNTKTTALVSLGTLILSGNLAFAQSRSSRPNIVLILADDLGYTDVNCFATRSTKIPAEKQFYETPNLNRLAEQGIAFSQAYSCPLCAPTRSSILTGKYASRLGFMTATAGSANTWYVQGLQPPAGFHEQDCYWSDKSIDPQAMLNGNTLIALPAGQPQDHGRDEITLAEALKGYHAAFLGKWHLGGHGSEGYQPHDQGFEELAYFDAGSSPYYNWRNGWDRKAKHFPLMRQSELKQGRAGADKGIDFLTADLTQRALDYIDLHGNSKDGKPFFLYFCQFAVHGPNQAPDSTIQYFSQKATKGWKGQSNATYAAMVRHLDISVGQILNKLEEVGIADETIVVFMSDNGGITVGAGSGEQITDNSPLTGQKANVYEGGIRVPLIIRYQAKVKGGKWCDIPVDCNDLFPTLLELAGEQKPSHFIDGQSIAGMLKDPRNKKGSYTRDTYFWHYPLSVVYKNPADNLPFTPHSAVRKGDFKLIFDWYGRLSLFNIRKDISEKENLAKQLPEKTRELFAVLMNYLEQNVEKKYWPTNNPGYYPATELRRVPYIDLYKVYKEGKDVAELANIP